MDNSKGLYDKLSKQNLYSKSYDDFVNQYGSPDGQKKLYSALKSQQLYSKSEQEFVNQYWGQVKKKDQTQDMGSVGSSEVTKPSSVSKGQVATGPSASFGQTGSKLLAQEPTQKQLPSTKGELLRAPEKPKPYDLTDKSWLENKQDINALSKDVINRSKTVASDIKAFNTESELFDKDLAAFNQIAQTNPNNPKLTTLQQDLEKRQEELKKRAQVLGDQANEIDVAQFELKKKAIENYKKKAEQGSIGGFTWNKIIDGLDQVAGGINEQLAMWKTLGAQTLDLFGIKTEELEKKPWLLAAGGDMYRRQAAEQGKNLYKGTLNAIKSKGTTEEYASELQKESLLATALGGVASSAPAMLTGPMRVPTMILQSIGAFQQEVQNDPELKNIPKAELDLISVPLGIGTAWLEERGLKSVLGKGAGPIASLMKKTLAKLPKNATMDVIKKTFLELAETPTGKVATRLVGGALGEGETETEQKLLENEAKRLYNYVSNSEAFKVAKFASDEYNQELAKDFKVGAIGSLIMAGPIIAAQSALSGKDLADDDYIAMKSTIKDPENAKLAISKIALDLSSGAITKEEADNKIKALNDSKRIFDKIPDNLPISSQRKAFGILADNAKIQSELDEMSKQIAGKDANLVTDIVASMKEKEAQIEKNNQQLSKLPQNAVQEQTTSEVPVQPEARVGGEMAEGVAQAEPQVPAEEGQVEEVDLPTAFTEAGEQAKSEQKDDAIRNFLLSNGKVGDTITLPDGEGYSITEVKDGKNGKEVTLVPFEMIDGKIELNYSGLRIISSNKIDKVGDLYETSYTNSEGERVTEKYTYTPAKTDEATPSAGGMVQMAETQPATEEVVTEELAPVEVSKLSDTQQAAIQEGVKLGEDMVKRYPKQDDLVTKYKALQKFQKTNQEYINADQSQKDEMTRQINFALGLAPKKKAPSAEKVLGKKADMVLVNEMDAIKAQLRLEAKAAKKAFDVATKEGKQKLKESKDALNKTRKDVAAKLKSMVSRGLLTPSQQKSIFSGLQTNINNPVILERFLNKVDKIINRADYVKDLSDANKLRTRIGKIATREGLGDPEKNIAKGFTKVDPKNVKDLTKYIKVAQEFIDSMSAPKVVEGKTVKPTVVNYQEVNKYLNDLVVAQGKDLQEAALARYDYLVQEGKITGDMSLDEIEAYVASIEQDPEKFDYPKSAQVMKDSKEFFEDAKKEILDMIKNGEVNKEDLPLIKDFIDINVLRLSSTEAYKAAKALENFIVNGSTENMGLILKNYTGSLNAAKMLKMLEYMKRTVDKKVKVGGYKKYVYGIGDIINYASGKRVKKLSDVYQETWMRELSHLDNFGSTYFGVTPWEDMKEFMGYDQIEQGTVDTKREVSDFSKKIEEKYKDRKNGVHGFFTSYTANELAMVGTLYRESTDKDSQEYFKERKKNITETIEYLEKTEGKEEIAERLRDIYDKLGIEKATSGKEVFDKANPVIQEALNDYIAEYQKWYPEFARIAKEQFGIILSQDVNYLPDFWESTIDYDPEADVFSKGGFATKQDILKTEKAGNFIKPKYPDGLPLNPDKSVSKIVNFDFFQNNTRALTSTIGNVKTAPGMNQYLGFVNSPDFRYIIKDPYSRKLFKDKMDYTIRSLTNNVKTPKSGAIFDFLAPLYTYLGKTGARLGLSSVFAAGTQSLPLMMNTVTYLNGNPAKLVEAMKILNDPKVENWMNNMPYTVSARDRQAVTSIEFASNLLDKGDYSTKDKTLKLLKKAQDGFIDKGLVPADVYTARASWLAIYLDELRKLGVKDFNFEGYNNPESIKAAKEAERIIKREHNQSLAELLPRLYSGKDSARKVTRMALGPFSGYSMSMKDKIKTNSAILFNTNFKATQEEKAQAAKSMLATLNEQIMFNALKWGIRGAVIYAANKFDDEDEDALSKLLRNIQEAQRTGLGVVQSFTGSLPFVEEQAEQYAMNLTLDFIDYLIGFVTKKEGGKLSTEQEAAWKKFESGGEEPMPETYEEKERKKTQEKIDKPFRVYVPEAESKLDMAMSLVGGTTDVSYNVMKKIIFENLKELYDGGFTDKYDKFHPYTDEEKQRIKNRMYLVPVEISVMPTEYRSIQERRKKNLQKDVRKREDYDKKMEAEFNKQQ